MKMIDGTPRRYHLDLLTPAEIALWRAIRMTEESGAHPLLTEAVTLLQQAREKLADYVELEQDENLNNELEAD
jgi:hypothetical protein